MTARHWLVTAAILGALSVTLGAFGAHWLPDYLDPQGLDAAETVRRLTNWETAAQYQMYHALALIGVAWLTSRGSNIWATIAGSLMVAGTVIFSGCLYVLVLTGLTLLGAIVPIGGLLLIVGWITLAVAAWRSHELRSPTA